MDNWVYLVNIILYRSSCEDKGISALKLFYTICSFCLPVFDPLCLIQYDNIRQKNRVNLLLIIKNLFIISKIEKRLTFVYLISFMLCAFDRTNIKDCKFIYLLFLFNFQRCRRYDKNPLDIIQVFQKHTSGYCLNSFTKPHIISKKRSFIKR